MVGVLRNLILMYKLKYVLSFYTIIRSRWRLTDDLIVFIQADRKLHVPFVKYWPVDEKSDQTI